MAIKALPESTVHLLGASQVLTTPTSLIKELIDNAIDAKATSIDILISQNTIDKIEVRDNGHGIQAEDLNLLGKRGHTSKLGSYEELRTIGGESLGFRGEALASCCQLGNVSVTTRMNDQPVGTCVKLKSTGGIETQSRTSHPFGTTVCVTNFIAKLPVRKQNALKEAPKTLTKIQELVKAYALARISVKFSLKIVKGSKGAWSYAPRRQGTIKDSVSLVLGRDAALQCVEISKLFPGSSSDKSLPPAEMETAVQDGIGTPALLTNSSSFCLEAFLPRRDADLGKLGHGQYLSIDNRPVSHDKGSMKKIVTAFKKYLKNALTDPASEKYKNPFIRLNILCPKASYDPNVEPAKDDVLFEDESLILDAVEKMFREFYGGCDFISAAGHKHTRQKTNGFDILLARKPEVINSTLESPISLASKGTNPLANSDSTLDRQTSDTDGRIVNESPPNSRSNEHLEEQTDKQRRRWDFDMSSDHIEYTNDYRQPTQVFGKRGDGERQSSNSRPGSSSSAHLNPWTIAKMTASLADGGGGSVNTSASSNQPGIHDQTMRPQDSPPPSIGNSSAGTEAVQRPLGRDFVTARSFAEESMVSPPNTVPLALQQSKQSRVRPVSRPFKPPSFQLDRLHQTQLAQQYQPFQVHREPVQVSPPPVSPEAGQPNSELDWAMDFENRKEAATRQRRDELRAAKEKPIQPPMSQSVEKPSPHKNRYLAALASLGTPQSIQIEEHPKSDAESFKTTLPDSDPRGYLMNRQKSFSTLSSITKEPRKLKRAQTIRLPFEAIPEELQLHSLVKIIRTGGEDVKKLMLETTKQDMYVRRGNTVPGLEMDAADEAVVGQKLYRVVKSWMSSSISGDCDVEFIFGNLGIMSGTEDTD
ncbi:dna mismatch repair protein [Rutstroemia sp. NJR-2017a BVV2]|nr:dna mismatch repair protein [Rutstroemia sp. NJR-2017a BVV2]